MISILYKSFLFLDLCKFANIQYKLTNSILVLGYFGRKLDISFKAAVKQRTRLIVHVCIYITTFKLGLTDLADSDDHHIFGRFRFE